MAASRTLLSGRLSGLWHNPDFLKLWAGQTVSLFGSQITLLALPLTAALTLRASAAQMGILSAAGSVPNLLVGLFAGVWVDRLQRRPILIGTNIGRAVLLGSIPLAWYLDLLRIEYLYIVAFLVGILTVFFGVAYQSFLPSLVHSEELGEANAKLAMSQSIALTAGPGMAGALVQLLAAPVAIALDAISFLVSAVSLKSIHRAEAVPANDRRRAVWSEVGEGLRLVLGDPVLRAIAGCTATGIFFESVLSAVYVLYLTRDLGIQPAMIGLIFTMSGPTAFLGALLATRVARRLGIGRTIWGTPLVSGLASLLVPAASGPLAVPMLLTAQATWGITYPVYSVNQVSLRQAITPSGLQGRMNATMRFLMFGAAPLGALLGGVLGQRLGVRPTLWVAALGLLTAFLWVFLSPLRSLREQPEQRRSVNGCRSPQQ